jgi:hypothetical protein
MSKYLDLKKALEEGKRDLDGDGKRFFKLFEESTFEGSRAAARKMKNMAKRHTKRNQRFLLFHSLYILIRSKSEMLSWPNSPLLVLLQFVDPSVMFGNEELSGTPLHHLADLADPFDYTTHVNQFILAKQIIERGANVNTVSIPQGITPLHAACFANNVTNLDFVELLLEKGADPNAQDLLGCTPMMFTTPHATGAAKSLLNWPTTDANITERSGASFLDRVRLTITTLSDEVAVPDNPEQVQDQFQLQQWREIEVMLEQRRSR